jgi:regulator of chromosome condensation
MRPPGSGPKQQTIPGLNDIPNYMEVDGDKDVEDIAVGEFHAIALTTDGCVYAIGRNENGQLGLGADVKGSSESWTKVSLDIAPQDRVISVASGPRSSFTLVQ